MSGSCTLPTAVSTAYMSHSPLAFVILQSCFQHVFPKDNLLVFCPAPLAGHRKTILSLCSLLREHPASQFTPVLAGGASFPGSHTWLPGNEAISGGGTPFQKTGWSTVWLTHHRPLQRPWNGYTDWGCAPRWCNPAGSSPSLYTGSQRNK